jgi:hypothetical protein
VVGHLGCFHNLAIVNSAVEGIFKVREIIQFYTEKIVNLVSSLGFYLFHMGKELTFGPVSLYLTQAKLCLYTLASLIFI